MRDKLRHERKALQNYVTNNSIKTEVGMIDTTYDSSCLGFTYEKDGEKREVYYHEPSLCFCVSINGNEPREIGLQYE